MKAFKGFNRDMTCRNFQYKEGNEYIALEAKCCVTGFHACKYPLDTFIHYDPSHSIFHEVELSGKIDEETSSEDSKIAATKIKIGAKLGIYDIVKASIDFISKHIKKRGKSTTNSDYSASTANGGRNISTATGNYSASNSTGYHGAAVATGNYSASINSGFRAISVTTGTNSASLSSGECGISAITSDYSASASTGEGSISAATGDYSTSASNGYKGLAASTGDANMTTANNYHGAAVATGDHSTSIFDGDHGAAVATGNYSESTSTGEGSISAATGPLSRSTTNSDYSVSVTTGANGFSVSNKPTSIAVAWGPDSKAKGVLGSCLVLADWCYSYQEKKWTIMGAKMIVIDGKEFKEDTWYYCSGHKIIGVKTGCVEVKEVNE